MRDDEAEILQKMIKKYRMNKSGFKLDDLMKMVPIMVRKCYNSIEMVYKEVLTEAYWKVEYDQMRKKQIYTAKTFPKGLTEQALEIFTLENLINRV